MTNLGDPFSLGDWVDEHPTVNTRVTSLMMQPIPVIIGWWSRKVALTMQGTLQKQPGRPSNGLYDLRIGKLMSTVELWVLGAPARDEAHWLSFYNGDAHDRSKCQLRDVNSGRFYNIEVN